MKFICAKPFHQYLEEALRRSSRTPPWLLSSCSLYSNTPSKNPKPAPLQERKMIDKFRLNAKGGDGGNGCCSFRRSRHDRHGRPDGGNGGKGGDVILECSPAVWDFSSLQHHINGKRGGNGSSKNKIGTRGTDKVMQVPIGTVIHLVEGEIPCVIDMSSTSAFLDPWDIPESGQQFTDTIIYDPGCSSSPVEGIMHKNIRAFSTKTTPCSIKESRVQCYELDFSSEGEEGEESDDGISEQDFEDQDCEEEIEYDVAELTKEGQRVVVASGGDGGLGNLFFPKKVTKNSREKNQAPELCDNDDESSLSSGSIGSQSVVILELKSIADVGLVGMPNAGKSTLLGAISRAQPTIGHYAFTTMRPNLGKLNFDDISLTVADIPGLIKGAHANRGLGHAFLRHIERVKALAYVVDLASGIPPWDQLRDLMFELEYHLEGLSTRPSIVVANKIDEPGAEEVCQELKTRVNGVAVFPVCAILDDGIPELKDGLRLLVNGQQSGKLLLNQS